MQEALEARLKKELEPELQVVRLLGQGTMGSVYLAREPALKRLVAVKVLSPELAHDRTARLRFEREAQSAASISHPNVVAVHTVGRLTDDTPFLVMQNVKGKSLSERLAAEGVFPVSQSRRIMSEVASALEAAHEQGIVHRDVKPGNILVEEDTGRALLTDFGIAAILATGERDAGPRLTKTGEMIGDPRYMSPEQLTGSAVTESSDIYSLGLVVYELLAGRSPYDAAAPGEFAAAHRYDEPLELSELREDIEPGLEALIQRCLAKKPEHRPNARALLDHLGTAAEPSAPSQRGSRSTASIIAGHPAGTGDVSVKQLFVSYVEEDSELAFSLVEELERVGYSAWLYERDSVPGPSYLQQTGSAIDAAAAVILVISESSLASYQVTREVVRAYEANKPIVPLRVGVTHSDFQQRQPEWREAVGAAVSFPLVRGRVGECTPRVVQGLVALGISPRGEGE